jgi:hypothetical protein
MSTTRFILPVVLCLLGATGLNTATASGLQQGPPSRGFAQERDQWDVPPSEWKEIQRRGFHDGVEGARKDYGNHRRPDVNNREEYRHPDMPWDMREPYREGFRRGYERAMSHLMGAPEAPRREPDRYMREPDRPHDMGSGRDAIERRAYEDGMGGARKDYGNNRRPDVNNRDEYRHPNVPYELQRTYRDSFRRGYDKQMDQLLGRRR